MVYFRISDSDMSHPVRLMPHAANNKRCATRGTPDGHAAGEMAEWKALWQSVAALGA